MAILEPRTEKPQLAVDIAIWESQEYQLRTALLTLAWSYMARQEYGDARDTFLAVTERVRTGAVSWWHKAMQEFGLGCALYLQEGVREVTNCMEYLIRAQYVCAFLGLQLTPVPDPRRECRTQALPVRPSHVIIWLGRRHPNSLGRGILREIRMRAIGFGLQDRVLDTLKKPARTEIV